MHEHTRRHAVSWIQIGTGKHAGAYSNSSTCVSRKIRVACSMNPRIAVQCIQPLAVLALAHSTLHQPLIRPGPDTSDFSTGQRMHYA
eukprot:2624819-Rhodomonas_salina.2